MTARRRVPNPLALAVLGWLLTEPMHPYELGRRLQQSGQDRHIKYNRGSLYMVVEQLDKAGFVTEQETSRDGQRPQRTIYAITDSGRAEFFDWIRGLLAEPQDEYPHFGVALSLMSVLPPEDSVALLRDRLATLTTTIEENRTATQAALDNGTVWVFLVEEDYALTMLEAEAAFVTKLIQSLSQPDYIKAWQAYMRSRA